MVMLHTQPLWTKFCRSGKKKLNHIAITMGAAWPPRVSPSRNLLRLSSGRPDRRAIGFAARSAVRNLVRPGLMR
jgi:hypothetical protein